MQFGEENLWKATLANRFEGSVAAHNDIFDVIVIGGGFTGLSAALHIALSGKTVCVLEAKTIGHGGSGRNVGYVNAGLWTPPDEVEEILGKEVGIRLNAELANGPETVFDLIEKYQIQCDAVRRATLHCSETQHGLKQLQSRYDQQIARGAPVRLLDRQEACEKIGSERFVGALWDPRAGTIHPLAYAQGLARAAHQAGAVILEHAPAQSVRRENGRWSVNLPSGSVSAEKLIQATNAYGIEGARKNEFIPVYYFQFATEPLSDTHRRRILAGGEGCWDCATVMSSFRLDGEGRLLIGAVGNLNGFGGKIHKAWAKRKMASLFPELAGVDFAYSWCGRIAFTSDHLPRVVYLGENAISIFGYSGRGISPGTVFGKCAAEWAIEGNQDAFPIPIANSHHEPFIATKSLYYEFGAVATHFVSNRVGRFLKSIPERRPSD